MGDIMQQQLTQALEAYLQKLDDEARIEAINAFRRCSTTTAPSARSPSTACCGSNRSWSPPTITTRITWRRRKERLLQTSLEADGFTQPVVVIQQRPQAYTIVDGFHRHELACSKAALKKTLKAICR